VAADRAIIEVGTITKARRILTSLEEVMVATSAEVAGTMSDTVKLESDVVNKEAEE